MYENCDNNEPRNRTKYTFTGFPTIPFQIPQFDPGPVLRKILDIPASPWPTASGIQACIDNFVRDISDQINNNFPNVSSERALHNLQSCMQRLGQGMPSQGLPSKGMPF
jgi:hypothetical protein